VKSESLDLWSLATEGTQEFATAIKITRRSHRKARHGIFSPKTDSLSPESEKRAENG
jgi:hypothetical protein